MRLLFLQSFLLVFYLFPSSALAWFDCYWPYRSQVTVTEQSGTALTNYQLEIQLNASSMHSSYVWSASGNDIRLVDSNDSTSLDFYIDNWDASAKTATLWVKTNLSANQTKNLYLYYGNSDATNVSNANLTFTESGIKFHTRNTANNPANKTAAFNAFDAASDGVAGYGCKNITSFTNVNNRNQFGPPAMSSNFAAYSETYFEVKAGETGTWSFRYGADFGRGGGLYVDDVALQEKWSDDLWWAYNWNNTNEILQGSINLTEGYHKLEVIGFEGCCDGGITVQFQKPGDLFKSYSDANIDVRSRQCPVDDPTIQFNNRLLEPPVISINKTSSVISDPVQGTNNPKRIPGAVVRYLLTISNTGNAADSNTIQIDDPIPANVRAMVASGNIGFTDGANSSGLGFSYVPASSTDAVDFSADSGTSYTYTPVADVDNADSSVTNIRFKPSGRFGCKNNATPTSFSIFYDMLIE